MKKALITGSTSELGQTIAELLAQNGYELYLHYHNQTDEAKKLAARVGAKKIIKVDLMKKTAVKKMFKEIGRVDALVNGVGGFIYSPLAKTTVEEFEQCFANNFLTALYCANAVIPGMRKNRFGRIINFGSVGCDQITARPLTTPYYIAKTALLMLTKSLAREETKNGITVNMISPGVLPGGVKPNADAPIIPYESVAEAVLFLLNEKNGNVSGGNLDISGGWRPE
ncbi:MAG: SDR family oxidoreductase [Patescibacteria group bacterium]